MKYKWWIVGGLVAGMLAMCVMTIGVMWFSIGVARSDGWRMRFFAMDTISAEADDETSYPVNTPAALVVENANGNVVVTGGAGDTIVVRAHKTAWGANQAEAEAALQQIKVTVTQLNNEVTVKVTQPDQMIIVGSVRSNLVDLTIEVPQATAANINVAFGDVSLTNLTEGVVVTSNSGRVKAEAVAGEVHINADFGETLLKNSQVTAVTIESQSGAVTLGNVEAAETVSLSSDFGAITFEQGAAAALTVQGKSGEIRLTDLSIAGLVEVSDDFGSLTLAQVDGVAYELDTQSGAVNVDGVSGAVTAHSDFGEVVVKNGMAATLNLSSKNGAITYVGTLADGPHTLESDFGNIRLQIPEDTALDMDLQTDFGSIKSELQVTMQTVGELSNDHIVGTLNGGGASLTARTKNGSIILEILKP